jgi:hypothetical protein
VIPDKKKVQVQVGPAVTKAAQQQFVTTDLFGPAAPRELLGVFASSDFGPVLGSPAHGLISLAIA